MGVSWTELSDEELLEQKISNLKLTLEGSGLEERIGHLYQELDAQGILFHPPCYLADEWFVPEGETVIGIPFYLAHPRLQQLEQKMMLEVEGGTEAECMKLLRHEAGHAIYYAYRLHRKRKLHRIFGPSSRGSRFYLKPYSKNYVRHLENGYAQTERDEDFAETFAVWLTPDFDWRRYYRGWKAYQKLEYVDQLMKEIAGKPPSLTTADRPYAVSKLRLKLKTYYHRKQKEYEEGYPAFFDRDLRRLFSEHPEHDYGSARNFLRKHRPTIVNKLALWTGEKKYIIHRLIQRQAQRCSDLSLRLDKSEAETLLEVIAYLTSIISNYRITGEFKRPKV